MKLPWKYIGLSLLIGVLLGGAGGMTYWRHMARQWFITSPERFLKHLDREVHLTTEQRPKIQALLNGDRDKLMAYQDTLRNTTRAEVRALLNSEQQARFDDMVARHDSKRKQREGH